ncbi:hypothetical protein JMUB3933_1488 [Leptotrichia wadei]|uniref:ATPase AAA-type core domain-containing protein n=1 Tax=Leptotrichia wadei TaxID=157687 RepID=A0A510KCP5_9FUSO|nr:ATP-binding protein [Leptotrichia wadei]BBM47985.1 hypothetical protein JMUB3933_1488 [Leptotrichia wadei]
MIIKFKNLGPIENGEIDLNDLKGINLIIGKNNTGKTYLSNFIYTVLRNIRIERMLKIDDLSKKMRSMGKREGDNFSDELCETDLPFVFHTNKKCFENTEINIEFDEKDKFTENEKYFLENIEINNTCFFPAERSGAILFYNQLLENRNNILRQLELSQDINLLKDISRYSEPVNEYIIRLNKLEEYENKEETEIYRNLVKNINIQNIIEGEIIIRSNQIIYKNENDLKLNMGLVSSTVKTLAGFFLYLKFQAQKGDIVFIDEIELNLHPENQRKIMKLINYLSKQGIKFIISTHSPVITQEMNNMIMFEKCKDKIDDEIIKEYSIDRQNYGLRQEDVNIYFLNNKTIEQAEFGEDGVITETFNEVLGEIDNLYQELLFAMEEE